MPNAIETSHLQKTFGSFTAVKDLSFCVPQGEVFSLLGPNGAGKSTTISMLSGLLQPSGGEASIMGHSILSDARAARAALGVVPQDIALYMDLSARENLNFWGKMYGLNGLELNRRIDETLEIIGLSDRQRDRVGTFSGGMKRRVNIGAALLHHPQVIIMDEPTVGIDPQSRRHILDNVKRFNQAGMTVLYTTHYMEEAEELSHHIAIVDQGQVVACGTHAELIKLVGEQTRIDLTLNVDAQKGVELWQKVDGVSKLTVEEGRINLLVNDSNRVLPRLFENATQAGVRVTSVDIREPNLETVFLHLTGKALRD
ncbi:MAG: ATP-binding cassette domain-containing protein [Anaerolineae bacterium]|nr:ATP-binding cassette domain-containing protein [Anaerolineae bacterium]